MQMLMDLGPVVYVEDFEKHFLAKAAEFYQVRSMMIPYTVTVYLTATGTLQHNKQNLLHAASCYTLVEQLKYYSCCLYTSVYA